MGALGVCQHRTVRILRSRVISLLRQLLLLPLPRQLFFLLFFFFLFSPHPQLPLLLDYPIFSDKVSFFSPPASCFLLLVHSPLHTFCSRSPSPESDLPQIWSPRYIIHVHYAACRSFSSSPTGRYQRFRSYWPHCKFSFPALLTLLITTLILLAGLPQCVSSLLNPTHTWWDSWTLTVSQHQPRWCRGRRRQRPLH